MENLQSVFEGHDLSGFTGVPTELATAREKFQKSPLDAELDVTWKQKCKLDAVASKLAGRPVGKNIDSIEVVVAHGREVFTADVEEDYHLRDELVGRYPEKYEAYRSIHEKEYGTPIDLIVVNAALVATLKAFGVGTVEKLIATDDEQLKRIPGAIELKKKGNTLMGGAVDITAEDAATKLLRDELLQKERELEALKAKVNEQNDTEDTSKSGNKDELRKSNSRSRK